MCLRLPISLPHFYASFKSNMKMAGLKENGQKSCTSALVSAYILQLIVLTLLHGNSIIPGESSCVNSCIQEILQNITISFDWNIITKGKSSLTDT